LHERLDRAVAFLSIISRPAGMMPAAMMPATASPALLDLVERGHDHLRRLRLGQQLDGHFGDHASMPFGADDERQQVVARRIERGAAEFDDLALDGVSRARAARCARSGRI
jgi:hypothetical protein